jgi:PAS domain S-box-containing protein
MPTPSANLLLIVSDEMQIRRLSRALEPEGYHLTILAGLEHTLPAEGSDHSPDLAIVWLSETFPDALGSLTALIRQIQSFAGQDSIPVLIIIDQYEARWVEPVFKAGVTDILTRPVHPLVLRRRVRMLLQARQTEQAVARLRESEQALVEEKERFRTVADFTYDWEYWSSPHGALIYNSPACERITGYPPDDFLENPALLAEIVIPEDRERFLRHQKDERQTAEPFELDFQIRTKTGGKCWIGHSCQQVHARDGRVLGRRISNRDITERKLAELTLVRSERLAAIGRLTASLSHEINNPLQAIFNSVELLQTFALDEVERRQYLHIIRQEIERLMKINAEILDFSRTPEFALQPTAVQPVIAHALFLAGNRLKLAKISVEQHIPADLPFVSASPDQLAQVFLNLIINASENMPEGGKLDISAGLDEAGQLVIKFTDSGSGIRFEDLEMIFDPFYTTKKDGTGLGLSISQKIIRQHNGAITAKSAPGRGSTFIVSLPVQTIPVSREAEHGHP